MVYEYRFSDGERSWFRKCLEYLRHSMNNPGSSYDEFRLEQKRSEPTTLAEWSARVDQYQRTGRWASDST